MVTVEASLGIMNTSTVEFFSSSSLCIPTYLYTFTQTEVCRVILGLLIDYLLFTEVKSGASAYPFTFRNGLENDKA